ncbi:MAG: bifunctional metallophosphatase/5'-nucleotidase [Flavobacteriaceae bacterium]|nr:bifunctional metallophosphatase/5'-nucleotidase [Flavobacteriaceae bacterium]
MKKTYLSFVMVLLTVVSCKTTKTVSEVQDDGKLTFKFVQLNDVYEIAPLSGGKYGGMARVAHVVDSIRNVEPNTYLFMAGDFLNPSLLGTIKVDNERVRGKQMIEVMNAMDFELVTFGNHEFDLKVEDLQKRMDESNFYWTSANVFQVNDDGPRSFFFRRNGDSIYVPETYTIAMSDADGTKIDVGLFSVTLDSNPQDYVYYADHLLETSSAYTRLQMQQADLIVGLTHLGIEKDIELANQFPEIALIMGGHEHNSMLVPTENAIVAKADANAKSIYIHTITYDLKTKESQIHSHLLPIDERTKSKPSVKAIVDKWNIVLETRIKEVIANPDEVVYSAETPLDGTDSANRSIQTNLGGIIAEAMAKSFHTNLDGALVNGGSIRLDDMLAGDVTSLDVFRVLPFGGSVVWVEIYGSLLEEVLDYGKSQRGTGAYLQRYGFAQNTEGKWLLNGARIEQGQLYKIAMSDFLLKGFDIPFLTQENEGIVKVHQPMVDEPAKDIRKAVILFMKSLNQ